MHSRSPFMREAGRGEAVACLHCSSGSSSQWLPLIERLAPRFRVLASDLHAQGRNAWPASEHDALADDVALLERVAVDSPVHLVGHSYGGAVALRYALRYPHRVRSLTLYEPALWHLLERSDPVFQVGFAICGLVSAGRLTEAARHFIDYWCGEGSWARLPEFHQARAASQMRQVMAHFEALFRDATPDDAYRSLGMPALVICGDTGPLPARETAAKVAERIPGAEWLRMPGLGHMGSVTSPDAVNPAIEAFLLDQTRMRNRGSVPINRARRAARRSWRAGARLPGVTG